MDQGFLFRHAPMSIRKSVRPHLILLNFIPKIIDFEKNYLSLTPTHSAPTLFPPTVALPGNLPDLSCGKSWFLSSDPPSGSGKGPLPSASPHSDYQGTNSISANTQLQQTPSTAPLSGVGRLIKMGLAKQNPRSGHRVNHLVDQK